MATTNAGLDIQISPRLHLGPFAGTIQFRCGLLYKKLWQRPNVEGLTLRSKTVLDVQVPAQMLCCPTSHRHYLSDRIIWLDLGPKYHNEVVQRIAPVAWRPVLSGVTGYSMVVNLLFSQIDILEMSGGEFDLGAPRWTSWSRTATLLRARLTIKIWVCAVYVWKISHLRWAKVSFFGWIALTFIINLVYYPGWSSTIRVQHAVAKIDWCSSSYLFDLFRQFLFEAFVSNLICFRNFDVADWVLQLVLTDH